IAGNVLVPARVIRPDEALGYDLAQEPVEAWDRYSEGERTFAFCANIAAAEDLAKAFRAVGVRAAVISEKTSRNDRKKIMQDFRQGRIVVICNVNTMTEGVNVPDVRCVMLCTAFGTAGRMIQATGRAMRGSDGKRDAIVIDLV